MNRYRAFTPSVFGRAPNGAPSPTAQLQPWDQVIPQPQPMKMEPQESSGPSLGDALMGGGSQIAEAIRQRRLQQTQGTAGARFGGQLSTILNSLKT